jgi:hypothetical protein
MKTLAWLFILANFISTSAVAHCNNLKAYEILTQATVSPDVYLRRNLTPGMTFDVSEKFQIKLRSISGEAIGVLEYKVDGSSMTIDYVKNLSSDTKGINKLLMAKVLAMHPAVTDISSELSEANLKAYQTALLDHQTSRITALILTPAFQVRSLFGFRRIEPLSTTNSFVVKKGKSSGLPRDAFKTIQGGFPLKGLDEIGRGGDAVVYSAANSQKVTRISHPDKEPMSRATKQFEERLLENLKLLNAIKLQEKIGGPQDAQLQFLMNDDGKGVFAIEMEKLPSHVQFPGALTMNAFWGDKVKVERLRNLLTQMIRKQTEYGFYNYDFQVAVDLDPATGQIPATFDIRPLDPGAVRWGKRVEVEAKNEKTLVDMEGWIEQMEDSFGH